LKIQAAAISLQGVNFVIALVERDLLTRSGEADMAIDTLQPKFGDVPVILMAQKDDGSPVYYGEQDLVQALEDMPVEKMPWKEYQFN
jgi:hypothetical protein